MKRFLIFFVCLVTLVSLCVIPAFASDFTLHNFVFSSSSDGETFTNQFRFLPVTPSRIDCSSGSNSFHFNHYSFKLNINSYGLKVDDFLTVTYWPRGSDAFFSIKEFYSGSLKYEQLNTTSGLSYLADSEYVTLKFYDKDKNFISSWVGRTNMSSMVVPYNAFYMNFSYSAIFLITSTNISVTYKTCTLTNRYSASEALKYDLNKPAGDPILPDNGQISNMEDVESQLLGGADSAKSSIVQFANNAVSSLSSLLSTFALISSLVTVFFQFNSWAYPLFYVSLTVGVFALLVNVSASFVGGKKS